MVLYVAARAKMESEGNKVVGRLGTVRIGESLFPIFSFHHLIAINFNQVRTLTRYILDELCKYEYGYSDMLMPGQNSEHQVAFMGEKSAAAADIQK